MLIEQLKVGTKIGVFVNQSNGIIDHQYEMKSQIVDVLNKNEFIILAPIFNGRCVRLEMQDKLLITAALEDSGLSVFEAESRELIIDTNGLSLYRVIGIAESGKLQRREYYRIQLQIPIVYETQKDGKNVYGQGMTSDISGGGIRFFCADQLEKGDLLNVYIRIEPDIDIRTQAKVIRVLTDGYKRYEISALFSIDSNEREKIIKYIFKIQREKLKRREGLIK